MKNSIQIKAKRILKKGLIAFLIIYYWIWMFYITQPATDKNTYKQDVFIQDIEINYAIFSKGKDSINIITDDDSYLLFMDWRNEEKTNAFVEKLLFDKSEISITVWKHLPATISNVTKNKSSVLQIIDLRTEDNIYFDIADFSKSQTIERFCGTIGGVFLTFVVLIFNNLELFFKLLGKINLRKNKK